MSESTIPTLSLESAEVFAQHLIIQSKLFGLGDLSEENAFKDWMNKKNEHGVRNYIFFNFPADPAEHYKDEGWKSWSHFLNVKEEDLPRGRFNSFWNYDEAKRYMATFQLRDWQHFFVWKNELGFGPASSFIPLYPAYFYTELQKTPEGEPAWKGWDDFLGNSRVIPGFPNLPANSFETLSSLQPSIPNPPANPAEWDGLNLESEFFEDEVNSPSTPPMHVMSKRLRSLVL